MSLLVLQPNQIIKGEERLARGRFYMASSACAAGSVFIINSLDLIINGVVMEALLGIAPSVLENEIKKKNLLFQPKHLRLQHIISNQSKGDQCLQRAGDKLLM